MASNLPSNPFKKLRAKRGGRSSDPDMVKALKQQVEKLKRAVAELTTLNELAREIGACFDSREIMERIVGRSLRAIAAEQAVITLLERQQQDTGKTLLRMMVSSSHARPFHIDQALLGWMCLHKKPLLLNNPASDQRFRNSFANGSIKSLLCVPLIVKSELIGVLTLYNKKDPSGFTKEDERLLAIIAGQSAQVIENARLYEEEKALRRMEEEIKLASRIQLELLPQEPPSVPGYDIAGRSRPAHLVGGDYFDFIPLPGQCWGLCLGDVSGKGLPAALLMANLQATLRGQSLSASSPGECLRNSNRLLYHSTDSEKFATVFYGVLDIGNHKLQFANGGHEHPLLVRPEGEIRPLVSSGLVLGAIEEAEYSDDVVPVERGDILVVYSDGVTEAVDEADVEFGTERLIEVVQDNTDQPAAVLIDKIMRAVDAHVGAAERPDDVTLLVAKRI